MKPAPPACPHCRHPLANTKRHCSRPGCDWILCSTCHARIGRWTHTHEKHSTEGCPGAHT